MPKYKNNTSSPVLWRSCFFAPGEEREVDFYIDTTNSGLTETSAEPVPHSPLLYVADITLAANGSANISIPLCNKFNINIITTGDGAATLKIGDSIVAIGAAYGLSLERLDWRYSAKMVLSSTAGATVNVVAVEVE